MKELDVEKAIAWYEGKIDEAQKFPNIGNVPKKWILEAADKIRDYEAKIQGLEFSKKMWCK